MENAQKKTVPITGGASGIGSLLGQCYAREGILPPPAQPPTAAIRAIKGGFFQNAR